MRPGLIAGRQGIDMRGASAGANGTFGELLQGVLPSGTEFLVTLPITLRSLASFRLGTDGPLIVYPSHKNKSRAAALRMLEAADHRGGGTLVIDSAIPTGKGLASSSADLVATVRAVGQCLGLATGAEQIAEWIRGIEPTDGVMYPGVVAFDHRAVQLRQSFGELPPLTVVAVDEGGRVDTVSFNQQNKGYSPAEAQEFADLLTAVGAAVPAADLATVGWVCTRSAALNQRLNPKRNLTELTAISRQIGALGVVCTHSGTMLGLLLDAGDIDYAPRLIAARQACAGLAGRVQVFHTAISDIPTPTTARSDPALKGTAADAI